MHKSEVQTKNNPFHSAFCILHSAFRSSAYTLIEMLTTVAVLIIVLGLMISLARHVRARAADHLTAGLLVKLDALMEQYADDHNNVLPPVRPVIDADKPLSEEQIERNSAGNNSDFIRALRAFQNLSEGIFSNLPVSIYNEASLYDAWGTPIVFMEKGHPDLGTAPEDRPFFFSAGPDRLFLTREDNLYSYEGPGVGETETRNPKPERRINGRGKARNQKPE